MNNQRRLTRDELAKLFGQDEYRGKIPVLTRQKLAEELGVSTKTLKRWEKAGILHKPINALRGAGRGNFAVYQDPYEGIVSILTNQDSVYVTYINGKIRWRRRRSFVIEDNHELV